MVELVQGEVIGVERCVEALVVLGLVHRFLDHHAADRRGLVRYGGRTRGRARPSSARRHLADHAEAPALAGIHGSCRQHELLRLAGAELRRAAKKYSMPHMPSRSQPRRRRSCCRHRRSGHRPREHQPGQNTLLCTWAISGDLAEVLPAARALEEVARLLQHETSATEVRHSSTPLVGRRVLTTPPRLGEGDLGAESSRRRCTPPLSTEDDDVGTLSSASVARKGLVQSLHEEAPVSCVTRPPGEL